MYKKLYKYKKNDIVFLILNYHEILGKKNPIFLQKGRKYNIIRRQSVKILNNLYV